VTLADDFLDPEEASAKGRASEARDHWQADVLLTEYRELEAEKR
jgi:hypothetical protein